MLLLFILIAALNTHITCTMDKDNSGIKPSFIVSSDLIITNALDQKTPIELGYHFLPSLGTIFKNRSWYELIKLTTYAPTLISKGKKYADGDDPKKKGLSNIIDEISDQLVIDGMQPLSEDEKNEILDKCSVPQPRMEIIKKLTEKCSSNLILATNQDIHEYTTTQEKLRKKNIEIYKLFWGGVVTTAHYKSLLGKETTHEHFHKISDRLIIALDRIGSTAFESALQQLNKEKAKLVFLTGRKDYFKVLQNSKIITPAYCSTPEKAIAFLDGKTDDYKGEYPLAEDYLENRECTK